MTTTAKNSRPWIIAGAAAAVIALGGLVAGPKIYAAMESSDVAAPSITVSTTATAAGASNQADQTPDLNGSWQVSAGSYAGYRVAEVLQGADVTVVGRTEGVTGTAQVADDTLNRTTISVDLTTVSTDSDRRDNYFRTKAIDTTQFPTASFTQTAPVSLKGVGEGVATIEVPGEISIAGATQPATATMQVARNGAGLQAAGSINVTWADFGVEAPNMGGFVTVEDTGQIEFSLELTK